MNFRFACDIDKKPFFKVWIDSVLAVDNNNINCYHDHKGPCWIMRPYGHMNEGTTVCFDEIRVGDDQSSYGQVAPAADEPEKLNPHRDLSVCRLIENYHSYG